MEINVGLSVPIALLAIVLARSIPFLYHQATFIIRQRQSAHEPIQSLYHDEDGTATKESQARYSVNVQKYLILFGCILGTAVAITDAVQVTSSKTVPTLEASSWLLSLSWVLFVLQALCILVERRCTYVFSYSAHLLWQMFFAGSAIIALVIYQHFHGREENDIGIKNAYLQIATSIFVLIVICAVPRRPDVYNQDGVLIDRMKGVSIFSRTSYSWANPLFKKATEDRLMEETDFPELNSGRTSSVLEKAFYSIQHSSSLFLTLYRAHRAAFIVQFVLTVCETILTFLPQLAIYKILTLLEARNSGVDIGVEAWLWVAALALLKASEAITQSYLYFLAYVSLQVPIRSQLSAVIFRKTILKKDVKGSQKADAGAEKDGKKTAGDDDDEDDLKGMKQGIINLLAIDSTRIADMAAYLNIIPESIFGIILGFSALIYIIGWQSLLAGLAVVVIIAPINVIISRRYTGAQDKLMKVRDKKMASVSEALQGIRQIKFSALESQWEQRIFNVRAEELATLKSVFINDTLLIACWIANPVLLSVFSLSTHAYIYGQLLPSTAFTALSIFSSLEFVLAVVPELTADLLDALVSSRRIKEYLDSSEKAPNTKFSDTIAIRKAAVAWAANDDEDVKERFVLRDLDMEFPKGELSLVSGRTGSGKSLLLSCLLGEADVLEGHVELPEPVPRDMRFDSKATAANWILPNNIAYVAQIPWMENATIRDNILFGMPYDERRYLKTLHACALEQDLGMLTDGEFTEIGANGINLSGGQRWRVSFARALYSRAGILILDDIFSAVDAHVGRHLFEEGLCGELAKGRTRILVTHHLKLCLPKAQYTVVLEDGTIAHAGKSEEFKASEALRHILEGVEDTDSNADEEEEPALEQMDSRKRSQSVGTPAATEAPRPKPLVFTAKEDREKGAVKKQIYWSFIKASGGLPYWLFILFAFSFEEGLILGRGWFIKMWTNSYETTSSLSTYTHIPSLSQIAFSKASQFVQVVYAAQEVHKIGYWIGLYTAISFSVCIIGTGRYYLVFHASLKASKVLFEDLTRTVLRAPLRWLDTVPVGRVLNRFSKDFETLDSKIANDVAYFIYNALGLVGVILAGIVISPYMSVLAFTMLFVCILYAAYYLIGAREVKRLESNSRSPIFEFFGSTLSGVATIRAFGKADQYVDQMFDKIDVYGKCTFYVWLFNRWMGFRMTIIGSLFVFITAAMVVSLPSTDASLAGFALSFSLGFTGNVLWAIRRYANVELDMNSTERIVEYINLPTESQTGIVPPAAWPTDGKIEVKNLTVSYAPDLPPVLKNVSFTVEPRQRVGVVGRTGAGKSSLTLALFRFINASQGTVSIDGLDTAGLTLKELRGRMAIIPQDPVLFSGTVRSNLDAFDEHEDEVLWEALERVHLIPPRVPTAGSAGAGTNTPTPTPPSPPSTSSISGTSTPSPHNKNPFTSLSSPISEGGLNLSQGQRQLLCLARAIVSRPKILVLDEATSAVDMHTEKLIRESMELEFRDCTTVVIAHRLATVVGYDRILVLSGGEVVEWGSPWELLAKERGEGAVFREMVRESGEDEGLRRVAMERAGV